MPLAEEWAAFALAIGFRILWSLGLAGISN
jgi:hypothetical protein